MADVIKSFILYLLPISCIIGFLEASFREVKRIEKKDEARQSRQARRAWRNGLRRSGRMKGGNSYE